MFFGFAETVVAFIRNSHIMGFVLGVLLFLVSLCAIVMTIMANKKGMFHGRASVIVFALTGVSLVLLGLVLGALIVKIINYSQTPSPIVNTDNFNMFSKDCLKAVQDCSRITKQSRNEDYKIYTNNDDPKAPYPTMYIQTSHTNTYPGYIIDGFYSIFPKPDLPIPTCSVSVCTGVKCQKRIGAGVVDCEDLATKFYDCMMENQAEKLQLCDFKTQMNAELNNSYFFM
jgi:hypothetical protein